MTHVHDLAIALRHFDYSETSQPPLEPGVLGGVVDGAVAVEVVEVAAVGAVGRVSFPERDHTLEEFLLVFAPVARQERCVDRGRGTGFC